ncbi:hypothetical protein HP15_1660 [Marinobacter adhaerens HP15]|uniref:Uncharacterized protein n=1 Tax=Marinobacter adhaerens (strain DSM 23420 / HP15) TaxID=225937 RepID=E4PMX5_MARAH|nr:hypothetical protein HP15_1660 [Marinobacter adhaerens HP15]
MAGRMNRINGAFIRINLTDKIPELADPTRPPMKDQDFLWPTPIN